MQYINTTLSSLHGTQLLTTTLFQIVCSRSCNEICENSVTLSLTINHLRSVIQV